MCARECNYWFSLKKKKKCSFHGIQIALISRKIPTAGLGLFKRHHDKSVSHAGPIFSFILLSFSLNLAVFLKKKKKKGSGGREELGAGLNFRSSLIKCPLGQFC